MCNWRVRQEMKASLGESVGQPQQRDVRLFRKISIPDHGDRLLETRRLEKVRKAMTSRLH